MPSNDQQSIWGVGPSIVASAGAYAAVAGMVSSYFPEFFLIRAVPHTVLLTVGYLLLISGILVILVAGWAIMKAHHADQLVTTGIFSMVRNPIYFAWIFLLIPGLSILSQSWLLLPTPLIAYMVFKLRIKRETEYLAKRFGKDYEEYCREVHEIIPLAKWKR